MTEIDWIRNTHLNVTRALGKSMSRVLIDIIEKYNNGFVHVGYLEDEAILTRRFFGNHISHQIRYIHNLYFFDFWMIESRERCIPGVYPAIWNISHYTYIYKDGCVLRDKIRFEINGLPGPVDPFKPSLPIYKMEDLSQEYFTEFKCPPEWVMAVNKIDLSERHDQNDVVNLFTLFTNLTETEKAEFYEDHKTPDFAVRV